jgi:hypothetical protein
MSTAAPAASAAPATPPAPPPVAEPPKPPDAPAADATKAAEPPKADAPKAEPVKDTPRQAAEKLRLLQDRAEFEKQRAAFAEAQKKLAEEKTATEARLKAAEEKLKLAEQVEAAKASGDPTKALAALGFKPDQIAAFLANGGAAPKPVDPEIAELKAKIAELTEAESKRTVAARTAEEQAARDEVLATIAEDKETLPWVNALGQGDAVIAQMQAEHKKSGTMDYTAAAKTVEARIAAQMPTYLEQLVAFAPVRAMLESVLAKGKAPAATPVDGKPAEAAAAAGEKAPETTGEKAGEKKTGSIPTPPKSNWVSKHREPDLKVEQPKKPETWAEFQKRKERERRAQGAA